MREVAKRASIGYPESLPASQLGRRDTSEGPNRIDIKVIDRIATGDINNSQALLGHQNSFSSNESFDKVSVFQGGAPP